MPRSSRIRAEARRCRRLVAIAVATFFCVQFVGGLFLDLGHPEIRYQAFADRVASLRRQSSTPDLVYLGSSRFNFDLDADLMMCDLREGLGRPDYRVFRGAVPGADALVMERYLDEMDRSGMHPPTLVLETVPLNLLSVSPWYYFHLHQWITWSDVPDHLCEAIRSGHFGRLMLTRLVPLYVHRHGICRSVRDVVLAMPAETHAADEPMRLIAPASALAIDDAEMARLLDPSRVTAQDVERGRDGIASHTRQFKNGHIGGGRSTAALERILERCARNGTHVILVCPPLSSAHREACAPVDAEFREYMDRIQVRYGATFVDCRAALPDSLFADHHHLICGSGTVVFSRYLAREVLTPLLREASPPVRLVHQERTP
jgi:hypothetical protein